MPRIEPLPREELSEFEPLFGAVEQSMGFLPNSLLILGRWPELLRAFAGFLGTAYGGATLPRPLLQLVAFVASNAAGCRYCQAHTAHGAERLGVEADKIQSAFEFETSPRFDAAERAALRLARDAALVPNRVEDEHFDELRRHFEEREILELVAWVSLFGWLNRWNDTLATPLESGPLQHARERLAAGGWQAGKHDAKR